MKLIVDLYIDRNVFPIERQKLEKLLAKEKEIII